MSELQGYALQLLQGVAVTLELALASVAFGLALGLAAALAKLSGRAWLRLPVAAITSVLRGVPEFVILLICFFGMTRVLYSLTDGRVAISPFAGGVFALSLVFGVYASEVFRGAFLAVPRGQIEAARALGLRPFRVFLHVHLPQAWPVALPSLNNLWQNLLKDTSLVSAIGLEEVMRKAAMAAQATKQPFTFYLAAAFAYLVLLGVSNPLFGLLERRARRGTARS